MLTPAFLGSQLFKPLAASLFCYALIWLLAWFLYPWLMVHTQQRFVENRLVQEKNQAPLPRVLFFAGLEGSGHHFLEAMYKGLLLKSRSNNGYRSVSFRHCKCKQDWDIRRCYPDVVRSFEEINGSSNLVHWTLPQQMSYPMCGGGDLGKRRGERMPHIDWFARASVATGLDFHVILLYRPVLSSLFAGCRHRKFNPDCTSYATTLHVNALMLVEQLKLAIRERTVRWSNIHCLRYGNYSSMVSAIDRAYRTSSSSWISQNFRQKHRMNETPNDITSHAREEIELADFGLDAVCKRAEQAVLNF